MGYLTFKFKGECEACKKTNQIFFQRCKSKKCINCLEKKLFKYAKIQKIKPINPFVINKEKAKSKKQKYFICELPCSICGKKNQKYYSAQNANRCIKCLHKIQYSYIKNDPIKKIASITRSRVANLVKNTTNKNKNYKLGTFENMFGCNRNNLIKHIESKFTSKMSWDNYGTYWHIDHIIPISSFDLSDPAQCKAANHWTNLQPLEASKNMSKSNKIINPQPQLMLQC